MRLLRRMLFLVRRDRHAAELAEEMEFHRSLTTGPAFGNATLAREDARAVWVRRWAVRTFRLKAEATDSLM